MSQVNAGRTRRLRLSAFAPFIGGVVEIAVFVMVANWIGFGWAILLALSTSVIGLWLMRRAGFTAWRSLRAAAAEAAMTANPELRNPGMVTEPTPQEKIADAGVTLLAGTVLVFPGFVTDAAALLLLLPPVRKNVGRRLAAAALRTFPTPPMPGQRPRGRSDVIEGEVVNDQFRDNYSTDPEERDS
ncbi:FxsA family protein [Phytoactinopolyspora mesophila]|uniref:FxsA family protein n=1 Tax=Phytoactinopolyspora mesophila TaxID=2650750 RepID=A0A7K3LZF1_9ACTN|nr:FxsA family protein [Phytoactinopolyspora mesophila]NDL56072.1 hypothetical protein [Phytoactinopolyspora mesophila]